MRRLLTTSVILTLAAGLAACGGGSSGGGQPTPSVTASDAAGKTAATAQIKANYATFFDTTTPMPVAIGLLEDGDQLGDAIALAAKVAKKTHTKENAVVKTVVFADPTHADVKYDLKGTPLVGADGKAVLQDGKWKVGKATFCTLVDLGAQQIGANPPPGC
jgi:hypothetical protein